MAAEQVIIGNVSIDETTIQTIVEAEVAEHQVVLDEDSFEGTGTEPDPIAINSAILDRITALEQQVAALTSGNDAPVASLVGVSGTAQEGQTLTGSYTYSDTENDPEGTSSKQWYRSDNTSALNRTAISGATNTTYVVQATDVDKYLQYSVQPIATSGTLNGTRVYSAYTAQVTASGGSYTVERTFLISMSNQFGDEASPWNDLMLDSATVAVDGAGGYTLSNIVDSTGAASTVDVTVPYKFDNTTGSEPSDATALSPHNSSAFPATVQITSFQLNHTEYDGGISISGLNPAKYYQIYGFSNGTDAVTARWYVGAVQDDILCDGSTLAELNNIQPDGSGEIIVRFKKIGGGFNASANAIVIEETNIAKT